MAKGNFLFKNTDELGVSFLKILQPNLRARTTYHIASVALGDTPAE